MQITLYCSQIVKKLNLFDRFSRYTEIPNLMKTCPVGAKFFHVGG